MLLENHFFLHFDLMNSPQPLSASQRGAIKASLPLLLPAREGGRGVEFMLFKILQSFCY